MSDLLANLNPEQRAAITLPDESALILAGAGSGKTRVLIGSMACRRAVISLAALFVNVTASTPDGDTRAL
jgi:hypothetical protein